MPKIVNHDAQRLLFADAAIRLIAQNGLEGVTMRAVAAEAGLSYGSLFHYFASKDELLMYAVERVTLAQTQRVNEFSSRYSGLKALEHLLCDDTIINASSRDAWMVWLTFLYKAALQQSFAEMHKELIDGWVERIAGLLDDARRAGDINQDVDVGLESVAIWAYSAGIGQMGLLDPARLPPKRQRRLIRLYLDRLRSDQVRPLRSGQVIRRRTSSR